MADKFAIGEIAIINRPVSKWHGTEVTILSGLEYSNFRDSATGECGTAWTYDVSPPPGARGVWCLEPHELRKRPPPREDLSLVRWDDCYWQPEREVVT